MGTTEANSKEPKMATILMDDRAGFYTLDRAREVAASLQANDPDWTYEVADCGNGLGRIDIIDEDGFVVKAAFVA